jgi:hypothetical protein
VARTSVLVMPSSTLAIERCGTILATAGEASEASAAATIVAARTTLIGDSFRRASAAPGG